MTDEHVHKWVNLTYADYGYHFTEFPADDLIVDVVCECGIRPLDLLNEMILSGDFSMVNIGDLADGKVTLGDE